LSRLIILITIIFVLKGGHLIGRDIGEDVDSLYQTTFIIGNVPAQTPHDASLFIAMDITGWYPEIPSSKFKKRSDGKYFIVVHHKQPQFEYKITRGSWESVEGRTNGRAISNRKYDLIQNGDTVELEVLSWEDLSRSSYNFYVYILYLAVLQAILLIIAILTIRNKNKYANAVLSVLLLLIALALIGRASSYDRDVFNWAPKILLIPEIILFAYAPVFYIYIHYLLRIPLAFKKYWWVHFIPSIMHVLLYIPYLYINDQTFIYRVIDRELFVVFAISGAVALVYNAIYWCLCYKTILSGKHQEKQNKNFQKYLSFLKVVLHIKAFYLFLWLFLMLIYLVGLLIHVDTLWITEACIDVLWVLFSLIIVCLAYYAMKQPEIFTKLQVDQKYKDSSISGDEFENIKQRLKDLLDQDKIFTDPELTLPELSNKVPTSVHTLSRVINEGFGQTFSQFINERRVLEFIEIINKGKGYDSFLSLAYQVGFNSKTTFNRSFKKHTGTTPRHYFSKD